MNKVLTVVIVNWNTGKLLYECLASLAALPEKEMICDVVVVDNASRDDSFTDIKTVAWDLPMTYVKLTRNRGFAAANNIGIAKRSKQSTGILLLNPDTIVQSGALQRMFETLMSKSAIGIVGAHLHNADGSTQPSVRAWPTLPVLVWLFLKLPRLWPIVPFWRRYMELDFDYHKSQKVDQVMGAALLFRASLLSRVGGLDESFWIWFEEVDYCRRVSAAGFEVWYEPGAYITHYGGASFNQLVGFSRVVPFLNSAMRYARLHLGFGAWVVLLLLWPLAALLAIPAGLYHVLSK